MKLDFALWDRFPVHQLEGSSTRPSQVFDQHFRQVEVAEQLGFAQYYVIEHQSSYLGCCPSPQVLLAALAQRTTSMRLGAMIWQLPFHNPIRLAQDVAVLDQISRGRVEFGTGTGVHEHEFIRMGVPFEDRQAMSEEALEIIRLAWTGKPVTYNGKFWKFDEALPMPRPYQIPHPPIWAGVHSDRAIAFAVREKLNVAMNIDTDTTLARKFGLHKKLWQEQWGNAPLPRRFLHRGVFVAESDEKARELAGPYVTNMFGHGRERLMATRVGAGTGQHLTGPIDTDDYRERRRVFASTRKSFDFALSEGIAIIGSPETVAKRIREQAELLGVTCYCCDFNFGEMEPGLLERSLELFGRHVLPEFR